MPDAVVITRPLAQAVALQRQVSTLGRATILFPLLDIQPLPDQTRLKRALSSLRDYAMVAFVSPNAIDAAMAAMPDWPHDVALAVVGEGSRKRLADYGISSDNTTIFSPTDRDRTDSETLLQRLDLVALRGKRVMIIRGESGRELLADALRKAGVQVDAVPAYRRTAPELTPERRRELNGLLRSQNDWVVTSSEALRNLFEMIAKLNDSEAVAKMQQQKVIVPHARIAETAREFGFTHVIVTRSGDEGVLAALQSAHE